MLAMIGCIQMLDSLSFGHGLKIIDANGMDLCHLKGVEA